MGAGVPLELWRLLPNPIVHCLLEPVGASSAAAVPTARDQRSLAKSGDSGDLRAWVMVTNDPQRSGLAIDFAVKVES